MSCNRECFDKAHPSFGRDDCATCPGRDSGAHKPEPNESPSSPRTRGSLAASPGQNEVEGTVLNSPPFSGRAESLLSQTSGETSGCDKCQERYTFQGCGNCVGD